LEDKAGFAPAPGMRARKESFGLLFYDTRKARLTFVRSRKLLLLTVDATDGPILRGQARSADEAAHARRILDAMHKKGLIVERSCLGAQ
jgi:putative mycofactocin binding protein MftB